MRILHTADWHLGKYLHGFSLIDDQAYFINEFVKLIGDCKPDLIVVAGDLYDRAIPPAEAIKLLDSFFERIAIDFQIPLVVIAGNHDSADRLGFAARLLEKSKIFIFKDKLFENLALKLDDQFGPVAICPIPYLDPVVARGLYEDSTLNSHQAVTAHAIKYYEKRLQANERSIAIAHLFLAGAEESESERPLSIGGVDSVDKELFKLFNYTALGHLHRPQEISTRIRYSGSPLAYSISEISHKKSFTLLELDKVGELKVEAIPVNPRRALRRISGTLKELLSDNSQASDDYIVAEIKDKGAVLDAMGRLRELYPNTIHIERPFLEQEENLSTLKTKDLKQDTLSLFSSFFNDITGDELSAEAKSYFIKIVNEVEQGL